MKNQVLIDCEICTCWVFTASATRGICCSAAVCPVSVHPSVTSRSSACPDGKTASCDNA